METVFFLYNADMEQLENELSLENEFHRETPRIRHRGLLLVLLALVIAAGVIVAGILLFPNASGGIVINEVMTSNHGAYEHPEYGTVDWVELYTPTDADIDLSGFGFTNEIKRTFRYRFPEGTVLKSGEYLVLYRRHRRDRRRSVLHGIQPVRKRRNAAADQRKLRRARGAFRSRARARHVLRKNGRRRVRRHERSHSRRSKPV